MGYPNGVKFTSTNQSSITTNAVGGVASIKLQSKNWTGTAKIRVTASEGIPYLEQNLNIPVGITLDLVNSETSPSYDPINKIVNFDIDIQGAELILEEMQISWDSPSGETLNKIEIKSPYTAESAITVFDGSTNPASSGELINVDDIILSTGVSNVKMYFNTDMFGKNILDVTFNPNSGDYTVNLIE